MLNILVTGGIGFIGSAIINELKNKHNIIILDNWSKLYPGFCYIHRGKKGLEPASLLELKHRNSAYLYRKTLIKNIPIVKKWSFNNLNNDIIKNVDLVINCGSLSEAILSQYIKNFTYESIVSGIINLKYYFNCPILHFSSSMVYGSWDGYKKENDEKIPVDWYGECKYKSEKYLEPSKDIILRPMHVYGFGDGKFPITMNIERQTKNGFPVTIEEADCIYIKDLTILIKKIIENWVPGVYNLSSGYIRDKEIIKKYSKSILGYNIDTINKSGPTGKDRGLLDCTKINKTYNWLPVYKTYEESIVDYFKDYKEYNANNS